MLVTGFWVVFFGVLFFWSVPFGFCVVWALGVTQCPYCLLCGVLFLFRWVVVEVDEVLGVALDTF